jgi:hypothetical protein
LNLLPRIRPSRSAANDPLSALEAAAARSNEQEAVSQDFLDYFHDQEGAFAYEDAYPEVLAEEDAPQEVTVENAQVESLVESESTTSSEEEGVSESNAVCFTEANSSQVDMLAESTECESDFGFDAASDADAADGGGDGGGDGGD